MDMLLNGESYSLESFEIDVDLMRLVVALKENDDGLPRLFIGDEVEIAVAAFYAGRHVIDGMVATKRYLKLTLSARLPTSRRDYPISAEAEVEVEVETDEPIERGRVIYFDVADINAAALDADLIADTFNSIRDSFPDLGGVDLPRAVYSSKAEDKRVDFLKSTGRLKILDRINLKRQGRYYKAKIDSTCDICDALVELDGILFSLTIDNHDYPIFRVCRECHNDADGLLNLGGVGANSALYNEIDDDFDYDEPDDDGDNESEFARRERLATQSAIKSFDRLNLKRHGARLLDTVGDTCDTCGELIIRSGDNSFSLTIDGHSAPIFRVCSACYRDDTRRLNLDGDRALDTLYSDELVARMQNSRRREFSRSTIGRKD